MGNAQKTNGKKLQMNFQEIAKNYEESKKKMMTDAVIRNQNHIKNFPSYHAESLMLMFSEWDKLFPTQKQDLNCTSCRKAVNKFWEKMVDEWIITEQEVIKEKQKKTTKKPNGSKKAKAK